MFALRKDERKLQYSRSNICKVHSRWIFPAKLLSRCKPATPFLVIFTLSCIIRDRAIESNLTSLILNVSLTCEIKSQIF
jgi:hypothetical protein